MPVGGFTGGLFDVDGVGFLLGGLEDFLVAVVLDDGIDLSGFLFVDLVALEGIDGFGCDYEWSRDVVVSRWERVQGSCVIDQ